MKFGVMYDFRNPRGAWWKPYPKLLRELLDQIVAVERMGYDNVWVTEHHLCPGLNGRRAWLKVLRW